MRSLVESLSQALTQHAERSDWIGMHPVRFARQVLRLHLWSAQRAALDAVYRGERRVYMAAGHGVGKTMLAAVAVCWALVCLPPPVIVITTAPTYRQVRDQIWQEVRALWSGNPALARLASCRATRVDVAPGHYAYGFSTDDPQRLQGIHGPTVLAIIDEANGFPDFLWRALESCLVSDRSQLLAIGNAIVADGRFHRELSRDDPTGPRFTVSARRHPNVLSGRELIRGAVTRQWIADYERDYSSTPELVASAVDAIFPTHSASAIITPDMLLSAVAQADVRTTWPRVLSLDVARYGDNANVMTQFEGQRLVSMDQWSRTSITGTADRALAKWRETNAQHVVVDDDGVGGGVTDILRDAGAPVIAFRGGGKSQSVGHDNRPRFRNQISEAWWRTRELLSGQALAIPKRIGDGPLRLELCSRAYRVEAAGIIAVEPKAEYCKRTGQPSPDHADSLVMGAWQLAEVWCHEAAA